MEIYADGQRLLLYSFSEVLNGNELIHVVKEKEKDEGRREKS